MTKQIQLSQGQVAIVDDEDFERVNQYKWCAYWQKSTRSYRAIRNTIADNGKRTTTKMHRFIMGVSDGRQVDHVDHDTLFNVRQNLRVCTNGQNQHNRKKSVGYSSRYKGVSWRKSAHRWVAYINNDSYRKHIGYFKNEKDAALSYDVKARELFGEFACLNFPEAEIIADESFSASDTAVLG